MMGDDLEGLGEGIPKLDVYRAPILGNQGERQERSVTQRDLRSTDRQLLCARWSEKAQKGTPEQLGEAQLSQGKWLLSRVPKGNSKRAGRGSERNRPQTGNWV